MKNKRAVIVFWLILLGVVSFVIVDILLSIYSILHTNNILRITLGSIPVLIFVLALYVLVRPHSLTAETETKLFSNFVPFIVVRRKMRILGFFGYAFPQVVITNTRIKIGMVGLVNACPMHSLYFSKPNDPASTLYSVRSLIASVTYTSKSISVSTSDGFIYVIHGSKNNLQRIQDILQKLL